MMLAGQGRWKAFCECLPHFREYLATWNKDDAEMSAEVVADARTDLNKQDSQTEKAVQEPCLVFTSPGEIFGGWQVWTDIYNHRFSLLTKILEPRKCFQMFHGLPVFGPWLSLV